MMSWRNAEYEDLGRVDVADADPSNDCRSMLEDTPEVRDFLKQDGRTWEEGGVVLAVVGVAYKWRGVGEVWTLLSDDAKGRGIALSLGVTRFIAMLHRERGYCRLQATAEHGDAVAAEWLRRLGFEHEGTMAAYAPNGSTHELYARVRR